MNSQQPCILFCESPLEPNKVDPDFQEEFLCAQQNNFSAIIFNYEDLTNTERFDQATKKIKPAVDVTPLIYRGWMLTPEQYSKLFNSLLLKNYRLVNTVREYQNCHYLPDSLKFIAGKSPQTIYEKFIDSNSIDGLIEKAKIFQTRAVIIKDYVKSEKHHWETACFVQNAADSLKLKETINNLLQLRGKYLNEGIVIREFVELKNLTRHSISGMPLTEEYRLFFLNKKLIGIYDYWEEGEYTSALPSTIQFEDIAKHIESNFFSMDIARRENGEFLIIELGDGQVSGLPDRLSKNAFYEKLRALC